MTQLLTVMEAATRLTIRPATVRKMLYLRRIQRVKIGRGVRIKEEDLEALIRHGYQPARSEDRR